MVLQVSDLLLFREEMAVHFIAPEVNLFPSFLSLSYFYLLQVYLLSIFFLSFSLFFQSSNL